MMYNVTYGQHQLVYNFTSFTLASMMACTVFFWLRLPSIAEKYKTALCITGLVTFIAFYHYVRIFNSWVDAYEFPKGDSGEDSAPTLTGIPFNDAYRYMDWLLTVPLLLMELVLVMKFDSEAEAKRKSVILGTAAALMIAIGYPGELITEGPGLGARWLFWALSMCPFLYIVWSLLVGLQAATEREEQPEVKDLIRLAQRMTVVSWCTYPFVYIIPMFGASGAGSVVGIQIGYCISDIISKCGVGLLTYRICKAKSSLGLADQICLAPAVAPPPAVSRRELMELYASIELSKRLGIKYSANKITDVAKGTLAEEFRVQPGWTMVSVNDRPCPKHVGSEEEIHHWIMDLKAKGGATDIVIVFELPGGKRQTITFESYVTAPDLETALMKYPKLCAAIGVNVNNKHELDRLFSTIDEDGSSRISKAEWQAFINKHVK